MENEYTIATLERCKIIFGAIPLSDMQALLKLVAEDAVMDITLADKIGATLVIGRSDDLAKLRLRKDLEPSPKRIADEEAAKRLGLTGEVQDWLINGERGSSSNAMCKVFFGVPSTAGVNHPLDSADFRRCCLFLATTNSHDQIHKMSLVSAEWAALVKVWVKIETELAQGNAKTANELMLGALHST